MWSDRCRLFSTTRTKPSLYRYTQTYISHEITPLRFTGEAARFLTNTSICGQLHTKAVHSVTNTLTIFMNSVWAVCCISWSNHSDSSFILQSSIALYVFYEVFANSLRIKFHFFTKSIINWFIHKDKVSIFPK